MYHLILGIVIGSTLAIIPSGVSGWTIALVRCAVLGGCCLLIRAGKGGRKTPPPILDRLIQPTLRHD